MTDDRDLLQEQRDTLTRIKDVLTSIPSTSWTIVSSKGAGAEDAHRWVVLQKPLPELPTRLSFGKHVNCPAGRPWIEDFGDLVGPELVGDVEPSPNPGWWSCWDCGMGLRRRGR